MSQMQAEEYFRDRKKKKAKIVNSLKKKKKKSFWDALKGAPKGLAKQMNKNIIDSGKVSKKISKRIFNPKLTPMQQKQLDSYNEWKKNNSNK